MVRTASGLWSSTTHTQFDAGLDRPDGRVGRHDQKHRLRTLKTMERYGFVRLHRGARGRIRPEVPYKAISLTLSVRRNEGSRPIRTAGVSGHISDRQRSEGRMSNLSCPAKYFHL